VLGDFGIAALLQTGSSSAVRLTAGGMILGDLRYQSPEQARGEDVVEQSDVYALGILAFELFSGRSPYEASSPGQMLAAHLQQEPADLGRLRPDLGADLVKLVSRCLSKGAARRPLAREVAARLSAEGAPDAGEASPMEIFLSELRRRNVYRVAAGYIAAAVAVLGITQVVYDAFELSRAAYRAVVATTLGGLPVALVLAWLYDIQAGGIRRTRRLSGTESARALIWGGLGLSLLLAGALGWLLLR